MTLLAKYCRLSLTPTRICGLHSFPLQTVEKLAKHKNMFEFQCKNFRVVRLRMQPETKRSSEENEAVWKQAYYAFTSYVKAGVNDR